MPPLITAAQYRLHDPECPISDNGALQERIDAAEAEIVAAYGPHGSVSEVLTPYVGGRYLWPSRRVQSVTSLSELIGDTTTVLDATDYQILDGGRSLLRLSVGATHPGYRWGVGTLVYVPVDGSAMRVGVLVDLVKADVHWTGAASWTKGEWSESQGSGQGQSRESQRREILSRLSPGPTIY